MKKIIYLVLCLFLGLCSVHARSTKKSVEKRVKGESFSRNAIFVSVAGSNIPASVNYEHIWSKNGVFNIGTKFGGFYSRFKDVNNLNLANGSFEVSFLFGRSRHLFDMGIGWTGYYGSFYSEKQSKTKHYGIPTSTFGMHYRFQKPGGGLFFKAGFSANKILLFATNDLTELAIGNAVIFGLEALTDEKPTFSLISFGIGYAFRR